jgi:hypothetical protein
MAWVSNLSKYGYQKAHLSVRSVLFFFGFFFGYFFFGFFILLVVAEPLREHFEVFVGEGG